jgi:hypothetical protein
MQVRWQPSPMKGFNATGSENLYADFGMVVQKVSSKPGWPEIPRGSCAGMCCRSRPKAVLSDTEPERYQRPQRLPGWLTNVIKAEAGIAPSMLSAFEDGTGLRCPPFSVIKTVSRILLFSRYWRSISNCSTGVIEKRTSRQPCIRLNSGGESISGAQPSVDGTVRADESNRVAHLR